MKDEPYPGTDEEFAKFIEGMGQFAECLTSGEYDKVPALAAAMEQVDGAVVAGQRPAQAVNAAVDAAVDAAEDAAVDASEDAAVSVAVEVVINQVAP